MGEKVTFKNKYNEKLAGILDYNNKGPFIIFIHGFAGNKDESNGLFTNAVEFYLKEGLNCFRFDMGGICESEGDFIDSCLEKQACELTSALEFLIMHHNPDKIGIVGFSLGATVSAILKPNIDAYSFWSPAFFPCRDMYPRYDIPEINNQLTEKGYFGKNEQKVSRRMLDDLKNCDLTDELKQIITPVQIIHGTDDPLIDYKSSLEAAVIFPRPPELLLIDGANHSYKNNSEHREELYSKSADFFLRTFTNL